MAALLASFLAMPAFAQQPPSPPADIPDGAAPDEPMSLAPLLPDSVDPATLLKPPGAGAAAPKAAPKEAAAAAFTLQAKLTDKGDPLKAGVVWRVFADKPGKDGKLPLVRQAKGGVVQVPLKPGSYIVHVSYGRAGLSKEVKVGGTGGEETIVLNAGALKLTALVGKDRELTAAQVKFDIYPGSEATDQETNAIASDIAPEQAVRLVAGTYHVVSRYGDANASVRADIRVEAGKLTEARLFQKAARITLKLVSESGGEALANTSWSVITPGGDSVFDSVGAFPAVVLQIGDYTAVAKHDNQIHEKNFTVESGSDREVEVMAK
jgi:hypothetical protein